MILVVDYGMGNLRSVSKALEHLGARVQVSADPGDIGRADKVVLPGVGAYGDAVRELTNLRWREPLVEFIEAGKPFLGICLGLQLLFPESEESPGARGLGIYPGKVRHFSSPGLKVPHMGWNSVSMLHPHPLLKGIPDGSYFYFVHSYYGAPQKEELTVGTCSYGGETFAAILGTPTLLATQFHPEKSQEAGMNLLKNFVSW